MGVKVFRVVVHCVRYCCYHLICLLILAVYYKTATNRGKRLWERMSSIWWHNTQSRYVCVCACMWVYVPIHSRLDLHGLDRQGVRELKQRTISANSGVSNFHFTLINGHQRSPRVQHVAAHAHDPFLRALRVITMSPTRATMAPLQ